MLKPEWFDSLRDPGTYAHEIQNVEFKETHISWVALTGEWAYKIKKPVRFNFVDFSTLDLRLAACREELRLNRRTAPQLYHSVVTLNQTADGPRFEGEGPVLEYAVRMRQFAQEDLLDHRLQMSRLSPDLIECLGRQIATLHDAAAVADRRTHFGDPDVIRRSLQDCFDLFDQNEFLTDVQSQKSTALESPAHEDDWHQNEVSQIRDDLKVWSEREWSHLHEVFTWRKRAGRVRECHGDLHLGNVVVFRNQPVLFDGLEFNPDLRWIDVFSDLAFLFMDLQSRNAASLSWRLLNCWLNQTGDFRGMIVLRYYAVYRALVRAKVSLLQFQQASESDPRRPQLREQCLRYLRLARTMTVPAKPAVILMHGVSGSGKTFLASQLASELGMLHIRSDIERKRLFLPVGASFTDHLPDQSYSTRHTELTYRRLLAMARLDLHNGYSVVVDATFLRRQSRERFLAMARDCGVPAVIVACEAPRETLLERLKERQSRATDASDADEAVLAMQLSSIEPFDAVEQKSVVVVHHTDDGQNVVRKIQQRLDVRP